jgi:uncharacterized cupredoxin-like copper-binding protein
LSPFTGVSPFWASAEGIEPPKTLGMLLRTWTLPRAARLLLCLCACASAPVAVSACSSTSSTSQHDGALVRVTARDFQIKVSPARVRAGDVRLMIRNKGPDTHELLIVRAGRRGLPLRSDGLTVDEEKLESVTVATAEGEPPDAVHVLRLSLRPGRYELFCNMAGHYLGGMWARLVVT